MQLHRLFKRVLPNVELKVVFKSKCKLSRLSKLKSVFPRMSCSNVVYRVNCSECHHFYIGKTNRRLEQRLAEHASMENSPLCKHHIDTGHSITYDSSQILDTDSNQTRLLIKETLRIKETNAFMSLNGNTGSMELNLW